MDLCNGMTFGTTIILIYFRRHHFPTDNQFYTQVSCEKTNFLEDIKVVSRRRHDALLRPKRGAWAEKKARTVQA